MSKIEDVVKDNKKTFEGIAKGMQKLASNPGAAAPANGEEAKVSFLPDIEIEPDLK
jgi:hypothetical protein